MFVFVMSSPQHVDNVVRDLDADLGIDVIIIGSSAAKAREVKGAITDPYEMFEEVRIRYAKSAKRIREIIDECVKDSNSYYVVVLVDDLALVAELYGKHRAITTSEGHQELVIVEFDEVDEQGTTTTGAIIYSGPVLVDTAKFLEAAYPSALANLGSED